jgi:hypothetical protein
VTGVRIAAMNVDTRIERSTASNDLGYYTVPLLPPGNYEIFVRHDGFRPITRSGITLVVDQAARVDFIMEVGAVTEKVKVTANASVVGTQSSTLKGVVDEHRDQDSVAQDPRFPCARILQCSQTGRILGSFLRG